MSLKNSQTLLIDDSAVSQLASMKQASPGLLKIIIGAGGCSGFEVTFDWVAKQNQEDIVVDELVCVHPDDLEFIGPARLVYERSLMRSGFGLKVSAASNSCGCGKSFSI
jgi:iron-sulfur cluster assembly accessory protein